MGFAFSRKLGPIMIGIDTIAVPVLWGTTNVLMKRVSTDLSVIGWVKYIALLLTNMGGSAIFYKLVGSDGMSILHYHL